jgi:hypothetical protein
MREKLIEAREQYVRQIRELEKHVAAIDAGMKFFDEHPDMETVAAGMLALTSAPSMPFALPVRY